MSMYDDIRNGKYKNKMEFPSRVSAICGRCGSYLKKEDIYCFKCGTETNFEELREKYNKKVFEHHIETNRLEAMFEEDALKDVGLENHPKKNAIFGYAWEKGHSSGHSEVYNELTDLVELFK